MNAKGMDALEAIIQRLMPQPRQARKPQSKPKPARKRQPQRPPLPRFDTITYRLGGVSIVVNGAAADILSRYVKL